MSGTWSQRIEQHYALQLPEDVRAWLDQQIWQELGGAEFCQARTPEQLLEPEPGTIWAGFMMPDTLPIIGNDYGDWLCLRIATDGTLTELIHWSHCGGDWIPYGRNLAEALLYDASLRVLDPQRPNMASLELSGDGPSGDHVFRLAQWAGQWVMEDDSSTQPSWLAADVMGGGNNATVLDWFVNGRVAEFAVRRDRILNCLESRLKVVSEPALARQIGVAWEPDFVRWLFDADLIPRPERQRLEQAVDGVDGVDSDLFCQDWAVAEREALAVIQRRQDLGWAFDVAGWAAQRRGDWATAVAHYLAGMQTSWFSDDTVRFRTHWFEEGYGKFAASRLATLVEHLTDAQRNDPYLRIFLENDSESLRPRVHQYWLGLAHDAQQKGEFQQAYRFYYRAGWDLGLQPVAGYGEIFDGLRLCATSAGAPALAAIAEMHQRFLA